MNRSTLPAAGRLLPPLLALGLILCATMGRAQLPEEFTNLKVLPQDISQGDLVRTMKGFTRALGQRCVFCHVGDDAQGLQSFDFASDEKPHKEAARVMMRMVQDINGSQLAKLPGDHHLEVSCMTCHRGQAEPKFIEDILLETERADGLDAGMARYRALRDEYYGSHTFDFSEGMLLGVAETRLDAGDSEGAVIWTQLNIEFYPESAFSHFQLGMIYAGSGQREEAIASLERALEINPNIPPAQNMLSQLKGE